MSNVIKLTTQVEKEKEVTSKGLTEIGGILTDQFAKKNVKSIVAIVYYHDEEEDGAVNYYVAGEYKQDREILGDVALLQQSILDGDI